MNLLDIVVVALLALFAVFGVLRGLVRQLFSIAGLVAGHIAGIRFYADAVSLLKLSFRYAEVAGYVGILLAVFLVFSLLGAFIEARIRKSKLSAVDRLGGLVAGTAKGALLAVGLVFLLVIVLPKDARVIRESKAAPYAIAAGKWLADAFPESFADTFRKKIRAAEQ
ncbi:MAG: CvpA family protein, partial [Thermodesulfobacteriota bacterium]